MMIIGTRVPLTRAKSVSSGAVPPTGAAIPVAPWKPCASGADVVDDEVLARIVWRHVGQDEDPRLLARRRCCRRAGDRVALRGTRALEPGRDDVAGLEEARRLASRACAGSAAARTGRAARAAGRGRVLILVDAEPSPLCSSLSSGAARAPLASSRLPPVDSSDCALPVSASSSGWTATMLSRACPSAAASWRCPPSTVLRPGVTSRPAPSATCRMTSANCAVVRTASSTCLPAAFASASSRVSAASSPG